MSTDLKQLNKIKKNKKRIENASEYEERLIKISRVSKVTKGGKKISFRAIAVVGNKNGKVGLGLPKLMM
jgi:small subunit ribosomal protein S5